jgi:hypothetical protein
MAPVGKCEKWEDFSTVKSIRVRDGYWFPQARTIFVAGAHRLWPSRWVSYSNPSLRELRAALLQPLAVDGFS